jgi:hypothetical protein
MRYIQCKIQIMCNYTQNADVFWREFRMVLMDLLS